MAEEKDFTNWHILKTNLQKDGKKLFFRERDIWLCSLGLNLGHEEDGKGTEFLRPVVVLRKFSSAFFWAIPLTSKSRQGNYFYRSYFVNKNGSAMLYQLRLVDQKRLIRKIGILSIKKFKEMKEKITHLLL